MLSDLLPGLLFLFDVAAFGLVVWWLMLNDRPGLKGGDSGLLAMNGTRSSRKRKGASELKPWERPKAIDEAPAALLHGEPAKKGEGAPMQQKADN